MSAEPGQRLLYTTSPHWRLTSGNDVLYFAENETAKTSFAITLSADQASLIRNMTATTSSINLNLFTEGKVLLLHLVGGKINPSEWVGTASVRGDAHPETPDRVQDRSFAEQVASEARSVTVIIDRRGNIQHFNRLSEEYTGLQEQEVIGRNVFQLFMVNQEAAASRRNITSFFRSGHSHEVERWIKTKKGQRLFLFRNKFLHSNSGRKDIFLICSGTDITEERRAQEQLRALANTDTLTDLPNRNAIMQEIIDALEQRGDCEVGLVYLDLDNFKKINDTYGHRFGDQLLQAVSLAILGCLDKEQTLARPGGDIFLILAENTCQAALENLAMRLLERLKQPFRIGLVEVCPGCSVSIAISPQHGEDHESLIRNADTAMYHAKENDHSKYYVFHPGMNQHTFEYC